jgi:GNAT superfamily N-acetyltransferase
MLADLRIAGVAESTAETAVVLLEAQLDEHHIEPSAELLREVVARVRANSREGFMLIAHCGDQPAGVVFAAAHLSAEHGGTVGWLEELYVVPALRGRGVGSALLGEVMTRARQLGWRAVELEVVAGHERAVPLYVRHGFTAANRSRFTCAIG